MSKFKVGDEVFLIKPTWGGLLRGKIIPNKPGSKSKHYIVFCEKVFGCPYYFSRISEDEIYADEKDAANVYYSNEIEKRRQIISKCNKEIEQLKKEFAECLSK